MGCNSLVLEIRSAGPAEKKPWRQFCKVATDLANYPTPHDLRCDSKFQDLQVAAMAVKLFEQVYPGQNSAVIKPKKEGDVKDWERKQRLKEYRIAARREKRNRKSDEKKQRKLNATILRRMVRLKKRYPICVCVEDR
jgi:hypothetical protein